MRYLARGWENGDRLPAQEVALVLAQVAAETPSSLLQACRRLIEHHPSAGVAWWLSARAIGALDPVDGIDEAARELASDPTTRLLAQALPGLVSCADPGEVARVALRRRHRDVKVARTPEGSGCLLVEPQAAGPEIMLVGRASAAAARRAKAAGAETWAVVARGALLPAPLWEALVRRTAQDHGAGLEVLPASLVTRVACDAGLVPPGEALARSTCLPVAELLGW